MTSRHRLSKERIISAALSLLDANETKTFSMRKLAAELNVDPMAVYHHFANKAALMHAVIEAILATYEVPEASGDWRADIRNLCEGVRKLAKSNPGAFRVYETYDDWVPAEHRLREAFYATLQDAGFAPASIVQGVRLLLTYTEAFAVDEIDGWLDPEDQAELAESLREGDYPTMIGLIDQFSATTADADFAFSLDVLIAGLEATADKTGD